MSTPVLLSWSGGKDSTLALRALTADPGYEVIGLLTSITQPYDRVSIHGVRRALLEAQADALGLPLFAMMLPAQCSNADYERAFLEALQGATRQFPQCTTMAFGDLFLQDVREYRERLLQGSRYTPLFPLWGRETAALAREFVDARFTATVVCVDTSQLAEAFAGRHFDAAFLAELPPGVDPCGERGEFHTFVSGGPGFRTPVGITPGETIVRGDRFAYCELLPVEVTRAELVPTSASAVRTLRPESDATADYGNLP